MKIFIARAVEHSGGEVNGTVPEKFVQEMLGLEGNFRDLQAHLSTHPSWATWTSRAACVPDRAAKAREVGVAIGQVCSKGLFDCGSIPAACKTSVFSAKAL